MPHYFTHYWSNSTWKTDRDDGSEGELLEGLRSNLFAERGIAPGDFVYPVTVIRGQLLVLSKMEVAELVVQAPSGSSTGRRDWTEASDELIAASSTPMHFDRPIPNEIASQLRFITGGETKALFFTAPGHLDQQTLRGVRQLAPESAALLDRLLPPMQPLDQEADEQEDGDVILAVFPDEVEEPERYWEGATSRVSVNRYERNQDARRACIEYWGRQCIVCDIDFKQEYGPIGAGFIQVHHVVPLADIGERYQVYPIRDLRPVCPNCHAMLHRKNPPYTVEELDAIRDDMRRGSSQ